MPRPARSVHARRQPEFPSIFGQGSKHFFRTQRGLRHGDVARELDKNLKDKNKQTGQDIIWKCLFKYVDMSKYRRPNYGKLWKPGDRCVAQYKSLKGWYPAVISSVNDNEHAPSIMTMVTTPRNQSIKFALPYRRPNYGKLWKPGDRCVAQYKSSKGWYPAVISSVNDNGTCSIDYDDGDHSEEPIHKIRLPYRRPNYGKLWKPGDRCVAQYKSLKGWYPAVISSVNDNGTCSIDYDDGDHSEEPIHKIRLPYRRPNYGKLWKPEIVA